MAPRYGDGPPLAFRAGLATLDEAKSLFHLSRTSDACGFRAGMYQVARPLGTEDPTKSEIGWNSIVISYLE